VVFVDLNLDVLIFDHLPTVVVPDNEPLSNGIFDNIFENKIISNIFYFFVEAIYIEHIVR